MEGPLRPFQADLVESLYSKLPYYTLLLRGLILPLITAVLVRKSCAKDNRFSLQ